MPVKWTHEDINKRIQEAMKPPTMPKIQPPSLAQIKAAATKARKK